MEKRELTNAERLFIEFIYESPYTVFNSVKTNYHYLFKSDIQDLLAHELLYPSKPKLWPYSLAKYAEFFTKTILETRADKSYKPYSSKEFFDIFERCIDHYSNGHYNCQLKKETIGRLLKLSEPISEDDFIAYSIKYDFLKEYKNVFLRENPSLKKSEAVKLLLNLNDTASLVEKLKMKRSRTEAFALTKISVEDFKETIDVFSTPKIFKSKATLNFLFDHEDYLKVLLDDDFDGVINYIYEDFYNNSDKSLSYSDRQKVLTKIKAERIVEKFLAHKLSRDYRARTNALKSTIKFSYWNDESLRKDVNFILSNNIIERLSITDKEKNKLRYILTELKFCKDFSVYRFDDIRKFEENVQQANVYRYNKPLNITKVLLSANKKN